MHPLRAPRRLADLINFRLQRCHSLSGAPVIRLLEGRYGITRREWRLLATLADHGPLSPSELAELSQLDRARTSRAIGVLVEKGLLRRQVHAADTRRARLTLTPEGEELHAQAFPEVAAINSQLLDALDEPTLEVLAKVIDTLTARAQQLNQELVRDVKAERQSGGSRRVRGAPPGGQV
ncbi:MAG: MarR family transcriptional regulator [Burkholderiales bacterium]|nr:MAG: MarR family transcriptional regulator [Burkholderiales bacterium]